MDAYGNSAGSIQCKGQLKQPIMACGHGAENRGCNSLETRLQNSQNSATARCGKIQCGI